MRPTAVLAGLSLLAALASLPSIASDALPEPTGDVPLMEEQAEAAGLAHAYRGPWEYFVGGGAASFDCNGDRLPELFIAGGKEPARFYLNRSTAGGALRFEETALGLDRDDLENVLGAYALDIDDDAQLDLVLLRVGENLILKGAPDCGFEKANRHFAFDGGKAWTTAFSATWEEGRRFPTLAFGNYVDRHAPGSPWGTCHDNDLYRPAGTETADYSGRMALRPGFCALSMLFTDWNRSGTPALRITNDRHYYRGGEEQLWRVDPGRPARPYRKSEGWQHLTIWGMGIAEGDLDGDGFPEYALTSMGDTKLQKLSEEADTDEPTYVDIAFDKGATAHRPYASDDLKPSTGWHSEFADFNNDGLLDLFIAKGNVERMPDFAAVDPDNLLLGQWDGSFIEAGHLAGINLPTKGRGAVVEDFNADGMLDLLVVNREQNVTLFRNRGARVAFGARPMGNFLAVELSQPGPNRNAVGALVSVKAGNNTYNRTVQVGGGHASGHAGFVHVGLGTAERAQVRVKWPDGEWSAPYRVFANNFVLIGREANAARYWYPPEADDTITPSDKGDAWQASDAQ
ncbi:VCBS repeat-containing protein [Nitratireductor mangrovi]|uniref:VCBS repeat-containing protein n=1 Tax=Nitratireductor mangrovi TaxID=2599600 RepID=A0A5B8KW41_9HYPH|nr:VCBS repeat-containing protein [Nitratireductor mangrovi]QDY99824.1 VCBS repeat-containing protein [Nitratireductor mangrovi]